MIKLVLPVIAAAALSTAAMASQQVTVSDGDSLRVDGVKVRIIGFNAPETSGKLCKYGDAYRERRLGFMATNYLRKLLKEQPYEIKFHNRKDRYGRELAQVFIKGRDLTEIMVGQGLAVKYDCPRYRCPKRIDWCEHLSTRKNN